MRKSGVTRNAINVGYGIHPEYYFGGPYGTIPQRANQTKYKALMGKMSGGKRVKKSGKRTMKGGWHKVSKETLALRDKFQAGLANLKKKIQGGQITNELQRQNNVMTWIENHDLPSELQEENKTRLMEQAPPPPPPLDFTADILANQRKRLRRTVTQERKKTSGALIPADVLQAQRGKLRHREMDYTPKKYDSDFIFSPEMLLGQKGRLRHVQEYADMPAPPTALVPPPLKRQHERGFDELISERRGVVKKTPQRIAGVNIRIPTLVGLTQEIPIGESEEQPSEDPEGNKDARDLYDEIDELKPNSTTSNDPYTSRLLNSMQNKLNVPELPLGPNNEEMRRKAWGWDTLAEQEESEGSGVVVRRKRKPARKIARFY